VEILCIGLEQIQQSAGGKDVIAHRGVDTAGIAGHRRRVRALFMKGQNTSNLIGLDNAKFGCKFSGEWIGGDGDFPAFGSVKIDHAGNVHAVDMIATEYRHQLRIGLFDKIDVLKYRIGSSLVPGFILRTHLCGNVDDEMALEQSAELPSLAEVLEQGLTAELGEHVNGVDAGVDEVAEDEIDDPVFAPKGDRRLGTFPREGKEPRSLTTGEHDAQHTGVQASLLTQSGFAFGILFLRQSAPPFMSHDVTREEYRCIKSQPGCYSDWRGICGKASSDNRCRYGTLRIAYARSSSAIFRKRIFKSSKCSTGTRTSLSSYVRT
jgi:hypothetical protein